MLYCVQSIHILSLIQWSLLFFVLVLLYIYVLGITMFDLFCGKEIVKPGSSTWSSGKLWLRINKQGGMGVRNLKIHNQCPMMKWLWRFTSGEQSLWKDVIQTKYELEDHWIIKTVTSTYGSRLWKAIRNLWPKLRRNCSIKLGDGRKTSFWEDRWLEQGSLKALFPDIFTLNQQTVAEIWSNQG